jgi:hypothetical protein
MPHHSTLPNSAPLDVDLGSAIYWLRQTYRNERIHSKGHRPHWTVARALRMLRPNLRRPVFAVGAPRSGTTFLGACLSKLPEISYHFEPVVTKAAVRHVFERDWPEYRLRLLYRATYAWLMRMSVETDLRFCEKTPGNCFILPFLQSTFPDAKFVHIIRDGRDAALSLSRKPWYINENKDSGIRDPDGYLIGPSTRFWVEPERTEEYETTDDLHRCIWLWRRYVEEALTGAASLPTGNYLAIRYEDLLADPATYADKISEFLDIEAAGSRTLFRNNMVDSARTDSIGGWQSAIDADARSRLHAEAGELLLSLGYDV